MTMDSEFDFVVYMWVLGILIAMVAVGGGLYVAATWREHDRRREEAKANAKSLNTWDVESPGSFGHR